ncbi:related to multidrug resistance protein [Rhynchosporium agropyri]|uniref:Related to multidrug resistance protein n=1 Tax=Rhynchosporium agropyri TaxID=914238 RepID=A0A1E1L9X2_9HELO|nr:related to multidrug resistance protein [Rhynchosporium agropyri]
MNNEIDACGFSADDVFGPAVASCAGRFDFTLQFEQIFFCAVPSATFILISAGHFGYLLRQTARIKHGTAWLLRSAKQVLILAFTAAQLTLVVLWNIPSNAPTRISLAASTLSLVSGLTLSILSYLEHTRSVQPSAVLNIYLIISVLLDIPQSRTLWLRTGNTTVVAVFTAGLVLKATVLSLEMVEKRHILSKPYSEYPSEALSGVLNKMVFWWINSLLLRGFSARLEMDDLFGLDKKLSYAHIGPKFQHSWKAAAKTLSPHALLWASIRCFWVKMLTLVPGKTNAGRALIGATVLIYLGMALMTGALRHNVYRLITTVRGGLVGSIYEATLKSDSATASGSSALTLMSTNVERTAAGFEVLDRLWAGPIEIGLAIYLLNSQVGLAFVTPVAITLKTVFVFISVSMRKISSTAQKVWLKAIERRVAATASTLFKMKGIKMAGLSGCVEKILQDYRIAELKDSTNFRYVLSAAMTVASMSQSVTPFLTLLTYVFIMRSKEGINLSPAVSFTALSNVSLLSNPIQEIAKAVPQVAAAVTSFQRIQTYICACDEASVDKPGLAQDTDTLTNSRINTGEDELDIITVPPPIDDGNKAALLVMKDADFSFAPRSQPILHGLSISIQPGTWTVITGPIGCGKSALLLALLSELHCHRGTIYRLPDLSMAYCAQEPWLPKLTIRQIVLGQTDFDESWYYTILHACLLDFDMEDLPAGDGTMVGSNGVSLSGGQRQRISLARALYSRNSLLILDDIMSGLDPKMEQAIAEKVLSKNGLLRRDGTTAVLATHSFRYASEADHVILMAIGGVFLDQGLSSHVVAVIDRADQIDVKHHRDVVDLHSPPSQLVEKSAATEISARPVPMVNEEQQLGRVMKAERSRQTGDVTLYMYYFNSLGWGSTIALGILMCGYAAFLKFPSVWVQWWSEAETSDPGVHSNLYRWLNFVLDVMVAAIAIIIMTLAIQLEATSAGALGVSLVDILSFSRDLNYLIRTWTDLETSLGAISRVRSFKAETPCEHLPDENSTPPAQWPCEGHVRIEGLTSSYRSGLDSVLRNASLVTPSGSKVGICGRTGSGKSTFLLTLLRMAEIEDGDVVVDGISLLTIARTIVRQRIFIMPQELILLAGTISYNVDPFSEHPDEAILSALTEVGIRDTISAHGGLESPAEKNPLSRGQQQLFCLARTILSKSRLVLLDEITSNVDAATEARMMDVVNRKLSGRTILAVAHHLRTIRDFDMIIVLDQGKIIESGSPDKLLQQPSTFRAMWETQ